MVARWQGEIMALWHNVMAWQRIAWWHISIAIESIMLAYPGPDALPCPHHVPVLDGLVVGGPGVPVVQHRAWGAVVVVVVVQWWWW